MSIPGDWQIRGTVIVDRSEECLPNATRIEVLRAVAGMVRSGKTLTKLAHEDPTGAASPAWTRIVGEAMGLDRASNRAVARRALAMFR